MKKILLLTVALFVCFSVVANSKMKITYTDGSAYYYYANNSCTEFTLRRCGYQSNRCIENNELCCVDDYSILNIESNVKKSREDYNRIIEEIKNTHQDAIAEYVKNYNGQLIYLSKSCVKEVEVWR